VSALRVAIVDDEAPARALLREYLRQEAGVEIVAECANGFDAVKAVAELKPNLLLLDVQMPKLDGFEVLELVGGETAVVFTTAYDEYALRAFDVHAVDYLLKPFSHERLRQALARARRRLAQPRSASAAPGELSGAARPAGTWLARIAIRDGANVTVVPVDKVDYIEAQDDYIAVHAGDGMHLKQQTLSTIEQQLDPRRFIRIHRSYVLNLDRLARLERPAKDRREAVLRDGIRLPVSESGYLRLQQLL
jgi:two-component system, LytTR family, response regulator